MQAHHCLDTSKLYYDHGDDLNLVKRCIEERDVVNMNFNTPILNKKSENTRKSVSGYTQIWKGEAKSRHPKLPPNIALYMKTPVSRVGQEASGWSEVEAHPRYIHVIHLIGFAFDNTAQPDFQYFDSIIDKKTGKKRWGTFPIHLRKMLNKAFQCAAEKGMEKLVLSAIGSAAFAHNFGGELGQEDTSLFGPEGIQEESIFSSKKMKGIIPGKRAYFKVFVEALHDVISHSRFRGSIELMGEAHGRDAEALHRALKAKIPKIELLKTDIPAIWGEDFLRKHSTDLEKTLYVNAWDPHSFAGNGNKNDPSLDGWFGRVSAVSYLSSTKLNSHILRNMEAVHYRTGHHHAEAEAEAAADHRPKKSVRVGGVKETTG